jgi:hypothetical protein
MHWRRGGKILAIWPSPRKTRNMVPMPVGASLWENITFAHIGKHYSALCVRADGAPYQATSIYKVQMSRAIEAVDSAHASVEVSRPSLSIDFHMGGRAVETLSVVSDPWLVPCGSGQARHGRRKTTNRAVKKATNK